MKIGEETEEDYRSLRIAVVGNNLFYLKKCALDLGDEGIYQELVKIEREFIENLERRNIEDTVDIALWYLDDTIDSMDYLNPPNKEELLKDLQKIREMIEGRNNKK